MRRERCVLNRPTTCESSVWRIDVLFIIQVFSPHCRVRIHTRIELVKSQKFVDFSLGENCEKSRRESNTENPTEQNRQKLIFKTRENHFAKAWRWKGDELRVMFTALKYGTHVLNKFSHDSASKYRKLSSRRHELWACLEILIIPWDVRNAIATNEDDFKMLQSRFVMWILRLG